MHLTETSTNLGNNRITFSLEPANHRSRTACSSMSSISLDKRTIVDFPPEILVKILQNFYSLSNAKEFIISNKRIYAIFQTHQILLQHLFKNDLFKKVPYTEFYKVFLKDSKNIAKLVSKELSISDLFLTKNKLYFQKLQQLFQNITSHNEYLSEAKAAYNLEETIADRLQFIYTANPTTSALTRGRRYLDYSFYGTDENDPTIEEDMPPIIHDNDTIIAFREKLLPPILFEMHFLKKIKLSESNLLYIPKAIEKLIHLERIEITNAKLTSLPIESLRKLPLLRIIDLSGNPIPSEHLAALAKSLPKCSIIFDKPSAFWGAIDSYCTLL